MAPVKSTRQKRSKTDIEQEFSILVEEEAKEKSLSSDKLAMAAQIQEMEIRKTVSEITIEVIAKKLSELNVEISKTLANLSEKMSAEVNTLHSLQTAVSLETKELSRLHGIDVAATSLDQLISDYKTQKESLEQGILSTRQEWAKEKAEQEQKEIEDLALLKKNRLRENEEYLYKTTLERKKLQDKFEEEFSLKEKQNREQQELLEKSWKERETLLKLQEQEFLNLKKEVEQFPSQLNAERAKAIKETTREITDKYTQEITSLKRDLEVEKQIAELKIKQLQDSIASQQSQMLLLQTQLEEAKKQVQDIAVKAIEGASGARALSHINQIAMEQAKNRPTA